MTPFRTASSLALLGVLLLPGCREQRTDETEIVSKPEKAGLSDKAEQPKKPEPPDKPNAEGKTDLSKVKEADEEMPAGASPDDIRAIKGAQAMLEAERKLRKQVAQGKLKIEGRIVSFDEISKWVYEEGLKGMPKDLNKLNGKPVTMLGFMIPIDEVEGMREFLLVESLWACCFGQPPDTNGLVRVVLKGARMDYIYDPIKVEGVFKVSETIEDDFVVDIFQIEAKSVQTIE